jgi:hypothetical protein
LFKKYPRLLLNEKSQMPHQTEDVIKILDTLKYKKQWHILFDNQFQFSITRRWDSAKNILKIFETMNQETEKQRENYEEILRLHAESIANRDYTSLMTALKIVLDELKSITNGIISSKAQGFRTEIQGWLLNQGDTETKSQIRTIPIGHSSDNFVGLIIKARLIGDQVVGFLEVNGKVSEVELVRVPMGEKIPIGLYPQLSVEISNIILPQLLDKIK